VLIDGDKRGIYDKFGVEGLKDYELTGQESWEQTYFNDFSNQNFYYDN